MIEQIKKYIAQDPISYIHITELLDRSFNILYASEHGFIVRDEETNFSYISFNDVEEMRNVLKNYSFSNYLTYDKEVVEYYKHEGLTTNLYQFVYESKETFDVSNYDIRVLTINDLDVVNQTYRSLDANEVMSKHLLKGEMIGIYENNKLAGFIGQHTEGCMGQLLVFEEYRNKGYATILEKALINKLLKENKRVFNEVKTNNEISLHIQQKLGFTKGSKTIYWYR